MTTRTTGIEWTEHTWNPFVGCSIHTAGCTNCYAMAQAARIIEMGSARAYDGTIHHSKSGAATWSGRINRASNAAWDKPFSIRRPSIIFVNSMSDFFHEDARDEWRSDALAVMRETPHQYQVLTKRPENIAPFLARTRESFPANAWIGATVERGDFVDRIEILRQIPATIRFLSIEPLIGDPGTLQLAGIHWVILGGESGPRAREMQPAWARAVRDQCEAQGVPLFFKQWGRPQNNPIFHEAPTAAAPWRFATRVAQLDPVGKGGSLLDGREWKDYPPFHRAA